MIDQIVLDQLRKDNSSGKINSGDVEYLIDAYEDLVDITRFISEAAWANAKNKRDVALEQKVDR